MELKAGHIATLLDEGKINARLRKLFARLEDYVYSTPTNKEVVRNYPEEVVRLLIAYHYFKKTLAYNVNAEGEIDGLLLWYRVNEDWDWKDIEAWTPDDPNGNSFFIGFCWAAPGKMRELLIQMIDRAPDVIGSRLFAVREKKDGPVLVEWSQKTFIRALKNYGKTITSPNARSVGSGTSNRRIPLWLRLSGSPGDHRSRSAAAAG